MVDRGLVAQKLAELEQRIQRAGAHCPESVAKLEADQSALDLVSFNLMLAVQSGLDIASHLISDERWAPAITLAASFERLAEHGVISDRTRDVMRRAARLRNVVAHGYARIDVASVHHAATDGLTDLKRFRDEVAAWVARNTPPARD